MGETPLCFRGLVGGVYEWVTKWWVFGQGITYVRLDRLCQSMQIMSDHIKQFVHDE